MWFCGNLYTMTTWFDAQLATVFLGAGANYRISHGCDVSEFNYSEQFYTYSEHFYTYSEQFYTYSEQFYTYSEQFYTLTEDFKCLKYKTECSNILLHQRYIELEKWAYFSVKIISYFACNKILNKK